MIRQRFQGLAGGQPGQSNQLFHFVGKAALVGDVPEDKTIPYLHEVRVCCGSGIIYIANSSLIFLSARSVLAIMVSPPLFVYPEHEELGLSVCFQLETAVSN